MGTIEEKIHHKTILLYKLTGEDPDAVLMSHKTFHKFEAELRKTYGRFIGDVHIHTREGSKFKGMKIFVQLHFHEEDYLEVINTKLSLNQL